MEAVLGLLLILAGVSEGLQNNYGLSEGPQERGLKTSGLENFCYFNQNETDCYGPLGGNVYLHLSCDAKDYDEYTLTKDNEKNIVKMKHNKSIIDESLRNQTKFFVNNVTLVIQYTEMNDSGVYKLQMFEKGASQCIRDLRLTIEAPVSSPQLTSECLNGTVRVSCSSQGDKVWFNWTLDGHTVPDTDGTVGNETNIITLRKGLSGSLRCEVRNHVSNEHNSTEIKPCPGIRLANCTSNGTKIYEWVDATDNTLCVDPTSVPPTTLTDPSSGSTNSGKDPEHGTLTTLSTSRPNNYTQGMTNSTEVNQTLFVWTQNKLLLAAGSLAGMLLVLVLVSACYCVQKKKPSKMPDLSLSAKNEDSQDVEYADIRINQKMRQRAREAPVEVEYGQVKVSRHSQPMEVEYGQITILPGSRTKADQPQNECVYASVQKAK
ncbi:hypothetical protein UPYG_G00214590 [Umbra pygmaea]|uniref:Ig-like domain-containing protein n=1 Tax=Umbra pygmaea TaxID=75934 RepID=A0ABD0WQQ8_UMBPY